MDLNQDRLLRKIKTAIRVLESVLPEEDDRGRIDEDDRPRRDDDAGRGQDDGADRGDDRDDSRGGGDGRPGRGDDVPGDDGRDDDRGDRGDVPSLPGGVEEVEVPTFDYISVACKDSAEVKKAIEEHEPSMYSADRPFVIGLHHNVYDLFWVGGGYNSKSQESLNHKSGLPLNIHFKAMTGEAAPQITGMIIGDKYNKVNYIGVTRCIIANKYGHRSPLHMICTDLDSTNHMVLDDVIFAGNGTGNFGGNGLKWGFHRTSRVKNFIARNVRCMDSPEEHTMYLYPGGHQQISDIYALTATGNRTWVQHRWPGKKGNPVGDALWTRIRIENHGQDWGDLYNGGSALTLWGNPAGIQHVKDVQINDSKYGAFKVTGDPECNIDALYLDKYHNKHVIVEDCVFDNQTSDEGEEDGDRAACGFSMAHTIEFRGKTVINGDLSIGSKWGSSYVPGYSPVKQFILAEGATVEVNGGVYIWDEKLEQTITVAKGKVTPQIMAAFFKGYNEAHAND